MPLLIITRSWRTPVQALIDKITNGYHDRMPASVLVPLSEYLSTDYSPDCDYVDGEVVERNMGEREHGRLQGLLISFLMNQESGWGIYVLPETRVQTTATNYRVPDILVMWGPSTERILTTPPFLVIEILSPEDCATRMQAKIREYLTFGVNWVWIIDPLTLNAQAYGKNSTVEVSDGALSAPPSSIVVNLRNLTSREA